MLRRTAIVLLVVSCAVASSSANGQCKSDSPGTCGGGDAKGAGEKKRIFENARDGETINYPGDDGGVKIGTKISLSKGEIASRYRQQPMMQEKDMKLAKFVGGDVVTLTKETWNKTLATGTWMIEFYAPWCNHCKEMEDDYKEAAGMVYNYTSDERKFAKVDAIAEQELAMRFNIQGYPTIYTMKNGPEGEFHLYTGVWEARPMAEHLTLVYNGQWTPAIDRTVDLTADTFDDFIESHPLTMVQFHAPWCNMCKQFAPHYVRASHMLHDDKVILAKVNIETEKELKEMYDVTSYPKYLIFKDGVPREFEAKSPGSIVYEMQQSKQLALTLLDSRYDLEKLTESDRHVILGVFDNMQDAYIYRFADVCARIRVKFDCYITYKPAIASRYPTAVTRTITTFKSKFFTSRTEERIITMPAKGNGAKLEKWIKENAQTLVGERTDLISLTRVEGPSDEYETYIPILVVYFDIPLVEGTVEITKAHRPEAKRIFEDVADAVRPFVGKVPDCRASMQRSKTGEYFRFAIGRESEWMDQLKRVRLDDAFSDYVAIMYGGHDLMYRYAGGMPLGDFIQSTIDGSAEPFNASQPASYYSKIDLKNLKNEESMQRGADSDTAAETDTGTVAAAGTCGADEECDGAVAGVATSAGAAPTAISSTTPAKPKPAAKRYPHRLTGTNYEEILQRGTWMVVFSIDHCVHCENMKEDYNAAAKQLQKKKKLKSGNSKSSGIKLGELDCTGNENFCREKFKVSSYPTIKFFKMGVDGEWFDFGGDRSTAKLVSHMKEFHKGDWVDPWEGESDDEVDGMYHI